MMECRDAQFYLRFRRPGADDLGPEVATDLDRHLAACPHCAAESRVSTAIDAAFASAMRTVPLPVGLRDRLVANLSAQRGTVLRRRAYRGLAVAASLFLAAGLGFGVVAASRPQLNVEKLADEAELRATDSITAEKAVRAWLRDEKLPGELPYNFNYDLLLMFGTERIQNRDVPVVAFRAPPGPPANGIGYAKVYVFRKGHEFKLEGLQTTQNSFCQAVVFEDQARFPGVVYVILTTNDLGVFLKSGPVT